MTEFRRKVMFGIAVQDYSSMNDAQQELGNSIQDGWERLQNPGNDCDAVCQCFKDAGYGVIEGHKHDIQRSQDFRTHVKEPLWKAVSPTTELIAGYVALHGSEDKDGDLSLWWGSCMGPSDNTTGEKGMKLKDLLNMLLELPSAEDASVYLFLDMCRSKTSTLVAESQAGHVARLRKQFQRTITLVFACASGQQVEDGQGAPNSPFATNLIYLLGKPVEYSIDELYRQLHTAVSSHTKIESKGLRSQQVTLTRMAPEHHKLSMESPESLVRSNKHAILAGVPPANESFTGRLDELDRVKAKFNSAGECAIVQTRAITGLGGVGKTQLAKAFAHRRQAEYDVILWVDAERDVATSFRESASVLVELGPELTPAQVKAKLEDFLQGKKWLIVFDNVEHENDIRRFRPNGGGHVLITSRYQFWDARTSLELGKLARIDSTLLLFRNIFREGDLVTARCEAQKYHDWCQLDRMEREPNPPTSVPPNIQDCWDLANLLDDFPLALVQASGAIWFFHFSIGDYCEKYKREYDRLQKEEDNLTERDKASPKPNAILTPAPCSGSLQQRHFAAASSKPRSGTDNHHFNSMQQHQQGAAAEEAKEEAKDGYSRSVHATLTIILAKLSEEPERVLRAVSWLDAAVIP
ncbi:unnamed protein product [Cladocopium goreaui]|uniref:NB-ARC domain-containing protein n=1 Tax=Cladocopium goreaui TaxID=2562237 RepID=A0A9P1GKR4_9DINO|nr:unnamed protein product [Cladocopium goreaui]